MSPSELKEYLAALPAGVFQVVLKKGDFELHMNVAPPPEAGGPAATGASPDHGPFYDKEGNEIPPEVAETFPHLVAKRGV